MFLIKTLVGPSQIHGNGVFTCDAVPKGTVVWRFEPIFDRVICDEELKHMPAAFREYIDMYAYRSSDIGGSLLLPCDHAKFLNHSTDPNTVELPLKSVASRLINQGDEITCDYSKFCVDWTGFDRATPSEFCVLDGMADSSLPHHNLYARLRASSTGVGVFAIRDIPEGTKLFVGDDGETLRVPVSIVDQLQDAELRRMYYDFCPVIGDSFIAPVDFNQITMGWYLNHSNGPNVRINAGVQFVTSRPIRLGEELTADYTTYSEHAACYVRDWAE